MKTRITEMLGIEYPIIQGGMAWVAEHNLAAAVSEAGGFRTDWRCQCTGEVVRDEIRKARELTDKPFGVNVMLLSPHAEDVAKGGCGGRHQGGYHRCRKPRKIYGNVEGSRH